MRMVTEEGHLQDCIRHDAITKCSLRQFAFTWGLKEVEPMTQLKAMPGPSDSHHNTTSGNHQEMGKQMNDNFFPR